MGHSPSRSTRSAEDRPYSQPSPSSSLPLSVQASIGPATTPAASTTPQMPKQSRRSSLRRSIVSLVTRRSFSKNNINEDDLSSDNQSRKRRKTIRRWLRPFSTRSVTLGQDTSPTDSTLTNRKGKQRETAPTADDTQLQASSSSAHTQASIGSPSVPDVLSTNGPESTTIYELQKDQSQHIDPDGGGQVPTNPEQATQSESSPAIQEVPIAEPIPTLPIAFSSIDQTPPSAPPRHFPPQGTLVVVQGVVNTTDAGSTTPLSNVNTSSTAAPSSAQLSSSRPNSSLFLSPSRASRSPTPTGDRNGNRNSSRLSSLIRRPANIFNDTRRSSAVLDGDAITDTSSSVAEPSTESSMSVSTDFAAPNESAAQLESDIDAQSQQRPLSPGSIEVLGTLLSVAAAATAASLFSPNSFSHRNGDSTSEQDSNRPTSPTPTAGLGLNGLGPFDSFAGLGFPIDRDTQQTSVDIDPGHGGHTANRDRLRGAWDSLRERLGMHNPRSSAGPVGSQSAEVGRGISGRGNGTGEMINEMARVLGTGLGLQNNGGERHAARRYRTREAPGTADSSPPSPAANSPPTPAEGSFERFLLNLQTDLRAVLSEDSSTAEPATLTIRPASPDVVLEPSPSHNQNEVEDVGGHSDEPIENEEPVNAEGVTQDVGADLVTRSLPSESTSNAPAGPNHDRRIGGGINLWRSYRFSPIVAPSRPTTSHQPVGSEPGVPVATSATPSDLGAAYEINRSADETVPSASTSIELELPPIPPPTVQTPDIPSLDVVIPVIIVGLQSVNVDSRGDQHDEHESIFTRPDLMADTADRDGSAIGGRSDTSRGRAWHSRAASAFRSLRTSRRPGTTASGSNEPNASRTFLIYVIGGYYPPNHHIVTGTDGMDSYDALWELAALLGQVKPPVATPEDIEKSGLKIIKPVDIERYHSEGQVASNCIDRCLICLDDYEPEDDLRVMSCKHFFHKSCVDKWLQIGRNNCPACRTKGVSTNSDSEPSQPSSSSHAPPRTSTV